MTKAELLDAIAQKNGDLSKKQVQDVVESLFSVMTTTLADEGQFAFPGFGSFKVRRREARTGRVPGSDKEVLFKASSTVGFKAAKALKDRLSPEG